MKVVRYMTISVKNGAKYIKIGAHKNFLYQKTLRLTASFYSLSTFSIQRNLSMILVRNYRKLYLRMKKFSKMILTKNVPSTPRITLMK